MSSKATPKLVVIEGKDKGKVIVLKEGTFILGRSKGDVIIQDPRISRSHISLTFKEESGVLTFSDLKSLNGTLINNEVKENGELNDGDKLQLGNTVFDCQINCFEQTQAAHSVVHKLTESVRLEPAAKKQIQNAPLPKSEEKEEKIEISKSSHSISHSSSKLIAKKAPATKWPVPLATKNYKPLIFGTVALIIGLILLSTKTNNSEVQNQLNDIENLQKQGKWTEAFEKTQRLVDKKTDNVEVWYTYGNLALYLNKLEIAISAYRKCYDKKNQDKMFHLRMAKAYHRSGLTREAMEELQKLDIFLKDQTADVDFMIQVALLYSELKTDPEKTLQLARTLQNTTAPDSSIGFKIEAQELIEKKKNPEAIIVLEKALQRDPKDEFVLENLAFAKLSTRDITGAMKTVESWIQAQPNSTKALLVMAYLLFNEKSYLTALPYVQKILQIHTNKPSEPDYGEAVHLMGKIYLEQNQRDEALIAFKKACSLGFQESCQHELVKENKLSDSGHSPASLPSKDKSPAP